jgi:hypothetical protein
MRYTCPSLPYNEEKKKKPASVRWHHDVSKNKQVTHLFTWEKSPSTIKRDFLKLLSSSNNKNYQTSPYPNNSVKGLFFSLLVGSLNLLYSVSSPFPQLFSPFN